jgi:GTP-binding protein HflX
MEVLLTDTVGFIQDLPTALVAAFRSTLEGVQEADLILHVVDAHHPDLGIHIEVVERELRNLQADALPRLTVFNKADLLHPGTYLPKTEESLLISALKDEDLQLLLRRIEEYAFSAFRAMLLKVPANRGDILSLLFREGVDMEQEYEEQEAAYLVKVRLNREHPVYGRIQPFIAEGAQTTEESW